MKKLCYCLSLTILLCMSNSCSNNIDSTEEDYQEVITRSSSACSGYNVMENCPLLSMIIADDDLDVKFFDLWNDVFENSFGSGINYIQDGWINADGEYIYPISRTTTGVCYDSSEFLDKTIYSRIHSHGGNAPKDFFPSFNDLIEFCNEYKGGYCDSNYYYGVVSYIGCVAFCIRNHSLLDDFASKVLDAQQQNSIRKSYEQITILGSDYFDVRLNGLINFFSSQNTGISVILGKKVDEYAEYWNGGSVLDRNFEWTHWGHR